MTLASVIMMIRPSAFGYNPESAESNYFQHRPAQANIVREKAKAEFDGMVNRLKENGIDVLVFEDTPVPVKPDAVFSNNWISTSPEGKLFVYPLAAPSRRPEKREDIIQHLAEHFVVKDMQDWSEFETEGRFLEGTGSMVTDHENKLIYATVSVRTHISVLEKFATANGYQAIVFLATDSQGRPVYHTNVMMALGDGFCILCEEAIEEEWELIAVRQLLESTGHQVIPLSRGQMNRFAGNMLELVSDKQEKILVMSQTAYDSLTREQREQLSGFARLLPVAVPVIEEAGGGSVRCMMTEIFLEKKIRD